MFRMKSFHATSCFFRGFLEERCREHLRNRVPFAFNATNTMKLTRTRWIDLFADYSARIEIVYVEPPMKTILSQNKNRSSVVPENVIRNLADKCEPPTWLECHQLVINNGEDLV